MADVAMAVAAHPDDIEFMMAGTLLLLGRAGYELHYMTVANGSCGTTTLPRDEIIAVRGREARRAAEVLGATYHAPLVDDIQIHYCPELVAAMAARVRAVRPTILLVPSMQDYMEDHVNVARLAVTAAFCRQMPNLPTRPPTAPVAGDVAVYHALPFGLKDPLGEPVRPHLYVDVSSVMEPKREALACHKSQEQWVDASQGTGNWERTMDEMARAVGTMSGRFEFAEGWQRRLHLGLGPEGFDPLAESLGELFLETPRRT